MTHHKHAATDYLPLLLSILCIGTSGPLGRLIDISPVAITCLRSCIGLIILLFIIRLSGKRIYLNDKQKRNAVLLCGLIFTVHWIAYFYALRLSSVAIGMLSMFTYPVITVILEPFYLKKKSNPLQFPAALIALAGIYIMLPSFSIKNNDTLGILLGIVAAFMYAARNLLLKKYAAGEDEIVVISWQLAVVVLVTFPLLFFTPVSWGQIKTHWLYLLFLGVITTAIGHGFFIKSLRFFSVSTVSILSNFTPAVGILLGMLFLHEKPSGNILLGGSLILVTALLEVWLGAKKK